MRAPHPTMLLALVLATGCTSITSGQRAQTLGKGVAEAAVETSYQAAVEKDVLIAYPVMNVAGRFGLTDRLDAGFRVGTAGLGAQSKILLSRDETSAWSLVPTVDWVHAFENEIGFDNVETALPVITTRAIGRNLDLNLAARLHSTLLRVAWAGNSYLHTLGVGSSVGVSTRVGGLRITPEVGALYPFLITGDPVDEMGGTTTRLGRVVTQVSLSFSLESER